VKSFAEWLASHPSEKWQAFCEQAIHEATVLEVMRLAGVQVHYDQENIEPRSEPRSRTHSEAPNQTVACKDDLAEKPSDEEVRQQEENGRSTELLLYYRSVKPMSPQATVRRKKERPQSCTVTKRASVVGENNKRKRNSLALYEESRLSSSAQNICIEPNMTALGEKLSHSEVISRIGKALCRGDVALFRFHPPTRSNRKERYVFSTLRVGSNEQTQTLKEEYEHFRTSNRLNLVGPSEVFQRGMCDFLEFRKCLYINQLAALQRESPTSAHIVVIRLQNLPEDLLCPPCFGDLCIIWSPQSGMKGAVPLSDRAQANPLVVAHLLQHLEGSGVLECYTKQRNANSTQQGEGEPLDYDSVSKLLFRRSSVR